MNTTNKRGNNTTCKCDHESWSMWKHKHCMHVENSSKPIIALKDPINT